MKLLSFFVGGCLTVAALPAFGEPIRDQPDTIDTNKAPRFLIVRVAAVGEDEDENGQSMNTSGEADVFPISMVLDRDEDGTIDKEKVRQKIVEALEHIKPVILKGDSTKLEELPDALQSEFKRAEKETEDNDEQETRIVAWRHYGPISGYSAGVVAHGRAPYYGYYRGATVPYYGYYAGGQTYSYAYGAYRRTPSYHYYGYYRGFWGWLSTPGRGTS